LKKHCLSKKRPSLNAVSGTGYQTAILVQLATEVFSIERIPALADAAESDWRRSA